MLISFSTGYFFFSEKIQQEKKYVTIQEFYTYRLCITNDVKEIIDCYGVT